ncbi:hypothetical protein PVIIG_01118 [Plasmodium vivax India VII]|uniref:Uncharacterized protein n=4 Tax=Plasmodium vivax TaxID=5855 RepID=A0A0J9TBR1_PLAVI|nr:hypothetical protein PVIIG_01118 [Plasmodium vivax India VII]KMZ85642.1 hypothetical protein PVBG_01152 [Plasmodium vivax Brazil I]KMZ92117.1 hypothetical protein PVMG_02105 [Plasmodium vivax Mauritania I]KMZ98628.1 hypothetical protein PVNG_03691 [Plasmodium vivax North Korean]
MGYFLQMPALLKGKRLFCHEEAVMLFYRAVTPYHFFKLHLWHHFMQRNEDAHLGLLYPFVNGQRRGTAYKNLPCYFGSCRGEPLYAPILQRGESSFKTWCEPLVCRPVRAILGPSKGVHIIWYSLTVLEKKKGGLYFLSYDELRIGVSTKRAEESVGGGSIYSKAN